LTDEVGLPSARFAACCLAQADTGDFVDVRFCEKGGDVGDGTGTGIRIACDVEAQPSPVAGGDGLFPGDERVRIRNLE
jgi:hypothetical protein